MAYLFYKKSFFTNRFPHTFFLLSGLLCLVLVFLFQSTLIKSVHADSPQDTSLEVSSSPVVPSSTDSVPTDAALTNNTVFEETTLSTTSINTIEVSSILTPTPVDETSTTSSLGDSVPTPIVSDVPTHSLISSPSVQAPSDSHVSVRSVRSPILSGTFRSGVVPILVIFSDAVFVSGVPQLSVATGLPTQTLVNYKTGSGTNRLYFLYHIVPGNFSTNFDYTSANALVLNGGSITDIHGNTVDVVLPIPGTKDSLTEYSQIIIDTHANK